MAEATGGALRSWVEELEDGGATGGRCDARRLTIS
jgi:hypothetical protein